jgi:hypothetical protein
MINAPERCAQQQEEQTIPEPRVREPRIRARGHLALVDWEETAPTAAPAPKFAESLRRSVRDRLYENSIIALLLVTVIAVIASLTHL